MSGVAVVVVVVAAVLVLAAVIIVIRGRRRPDTVKAFQQHIDALSPEARRPVVDRVQELEEEEERRGDEPGGDMRGS